jgi:hypothetical protein
LLVADGSDPIINLQSTTIQQSPIRNQRFS